MNKKLADSLVITNQLVMPNDTNYMGNLLGGKLMYWLDITAAMAAMKLINTKCVTACVDNLTFKHAIPLGYNVKIEAKVTCIFNTSLEVIANVYSENLLTAETKLTNQSAFVFVSVDAIHHKPQPIPMIEPTTDDEKIIWHEAEKRQLIRKIMLNQKSLTIDQLKNLL